MRHVLTRRRSGGFGAAQAAVIAVLSFLAAPFAAAQDGARVDLELVLAVDVSWSMDRGEQRIQREGYAAAFRSDEVIEAIRYGGYGRVAVTYVEWAGSTSQIQVVPWTLIDGAETASAFADSLTQASPRQMRRTSISGAIDFARELFGQNAYQGLRRIIDVSGDGPNNQGRAVTAARDAAVGAGITINGLPLMTNTSPASQNYSIDNLDEYYAACVIGGGQAFMIPVNSWDEFPEAVRRKLVLELAGDIPEHPRIIPAQSGGQGEFGDAQGAGGFDCLVGERLWRDRRWLWSDP